MYKYDYTIFSDNNWKKAKSACEKIENAFPSIKKHELLVDVDGTTIQSYTFDGEEIVVYDDYLVGAVYIKSNVNLNHLFDNV